MTGETPRPPRDCPLAIVTGAPGAGKTTAVTALLQRPLDYLVFDADLILPSLSELAGRSIRDAAESWPSYRRLWVTIAQMVELNGRQTILVMPIEPQELATALPLEWQGRVAWCLLDCDDITRRARLLARGWDDEAIAEAIGDAQQLRERIPFVVDTGEQPAMTVAAMIDHWLRGQETEMTAATRPGEVVANVL